MVAEKLSANMSWRIVSREHVQDMAVMTFSSASWYPFEWPHDVLLRILRYVEASKWESRVSSGEKTSPKSSFEALREQSIRMPAQMVRLEYMTGTVSYQSDANGVMHAFQYEQSIATEVGQIVGPGGNTVGRQPLGTWDPTVKVEMCRTKSLYDLLGEQILQLPRFESPRWH